MATVFEPSSGIQAERADDAAWRYEEAFSRNLGLISPEEQSRLRRSHVAIPGMGGVGGMHLLTLARMGIGRFTIADPDAFEMANFNRQAGAHVHTLGRGKAEVMAEQALAVNPELELRVFREAVTEENIDQFLHGVDLVVDGIDFFAIDARRLLFREARRRGIWCVTAGPIGFSAAWLAFDPEGMSFDEYFDLCDDQPRIEQLIAFAVGLTPKATHLRYLDLSRVNPDSGAGPSASLACQLCSGVVAAESLKILLGQQDVRPAPYYFQFDACRRKLVRGVLRRGNRGPMQRAKRAYLRRRLSAPRRGEREA
ncbi:MAG TPA: ThiF family adenylyltransferase [Pirellulales bacterium]|nr:ThiF family adenylyltransferase [Pirellulales bacterium]